VPHKVQVEAIDADDPVSTQGESTLVEPDQVSHHADRRAIAGRENDRLERLL